VIPLQEFQKRPRILTVGCGLTALEAASQLIQLGYEVLLACPDKDLQKVHSLLPADRELSDYARELAERLGAQGRFSFFPETRVTSVDGFAGDFQVRLTSIQKEWNEPVGAIILAPELASEENFSGCPPLPSGQIISLDRLVEELSSSPGVPGVFAALNSRSFAAFLVGLTGSGGAADMAQALEAAIVIRKRLKAQVYFFSGNIKVAEEGLERLYLECRDAGVVFFKFDSEQPELVQKGDQVSLQFKDPLLGQPFELTPDLLVIDSAHTLPAEMQALAHSAQLGQDRSGYLQPGNIHFWPYGLQRTGVFAAGAGRGPLMASAAIEEGRGAALAVHQFFQGNPLEPMDREVWVDKGLCTVCLTCLRFCPHQAIGWTHRVFIHPLACRRCGICAGECPMDAIQIAGYSDPEVENRLADINALWEKGAAGDPKVIVFGCRRSAGVAWEEANSSKLIADSQTEFIGLPCAGKIDPDHLLKALSIGADGVLVLACPEENCRSLHGNTYARERIAEAQDYLEEAGLDRRRLRFETVSSNRVFLLNEVIQDFTSKLHKN
jgi:coenzyme F420-reducing hydrogenase delta subunit/NAD-dependent dihydropyrimidine dehydrogenase PreA subunit